MSQIEIKHRANLVPHFTLLLLLTIYSFARSQNQPVHWKITPENPAYGLTLGYLLPKAQFQDLVGDSMKLKLDKNNMGYLMLFIAQAKKYKIDSTTFDNLEIAHILIALDSSLSNPFIIIENNEPLNRLFAKYKFEVDPGKIELLIEQKGDSIATTASISTQKGSINIHANFANKPGDLKTISAAKITAPTNSNFFFSGDESYRPIPIPSVKIESKGINWISQLHLPDKPDKIWLNTDFVWDFVFLNE